MWICQRSAYFKFIPSTHTHSHILIPFEDSEPTGLKVDIVAASVWDPYSQKNIAKIEAVQRRAARFILSQFRNTSSVNNMLEALGWPTLEQ